MRQSRALHLVTGFRQNAGLISTEGDSVESSFGGGLSRGSWKQKLDDRDTARELDALRDHLAPPDRSGLVVVRDSEPSEEFAHLDGSL